MDGPTRAQVRLLIDDADELAHKRVLDGKHALFADHAARGLLRSGATIKSAVRLFETETGALIAKVTDAVAAVSKGTEAFALIADCLARFDSFLITEFDEVLAKATGGKARTTMMSVERAGKNLFNEAQTRWRRQLEIHRFSFTGPPASPPLASLMDTPKAPVVASNKGGKPLAAHWDELWSSIAVALWSGDLDPKSQADIKRAMFEWFNERELEVGDTAVTARARQLWQKIEASR